MLELMVNELNPAIVFVAGSELRRLKSMLRTGAA